MKNKSSRKRMAQRIGKQKQSSPNFIPLSTRDGIKTFARNRKARRINDAINRK